MPEEEGKHVHQGVFDAGTDFSFVPALTMVTPILGLTLDINITQTHAEGEGPKSHYNLK